MPTATASTLIEARRIDAGLSATRFAQIAGITCTTARRAETGGRPAPLVRRAIADALCVPESEIFDRAGNPLPAEGTAA